MSALSITLPLHIVSEANSREHWRVKRKARGHYRLFTKASMVSASWKQGGAAFRPPCTVTLTRIAPRELDDDNIRGALKAIRDGVADWLGCDDSKRSGVTWEYAQARGEPKQYAVRIEVLT